jgi:hypothetical protein
VDFATESFWWQEILAVASRSILHFVSASTSFDREACCASDAWYSAGGVRVSEARPSWTGNRQFCQNNVESGAVNACEFACYNERNLLARIFCNVVGCDKLAEKTFDRELVDVTNVGQVWSSIAGVFAC